MPLQKALKEARDAINDLKTLEIQTYTGELDVAVSSIGSTNLEAILQSAEVSGSIKLSQVTKLDIDGDGINLVSNTPMPAHVSEAHTAALVAGENVRASILELFKEVLIKD